MTPLEPPVLLDPVLEPVLVFPVLPVFELLPPWLPFVVAPVFPLLTGTLLLLPEPTSYTSLVRLTTVVSPWLMTTATTMHTTNNLIFKISSEWGFEVLKF